MLPPLLTVSFISTSAYAADQAGSCPTLAVPAYYDRVADWDRTLNPGSAAVKFAVINPNDGPGSQTYPDFVNIVNKGKGAGIKMLGYVESKETDRSLEQAKRDADAYFDRYKVDGIFIDEVSTDTGKVDYYRQLHDYIKSRGGITMLNPGDESAPEDLMSAGEILCNFESDYDKYLRTSPPGWVKKYPANRFYHIVLQVPGASGLQKVMALAKERNAGFVYATNIPEHPDPYQALPEFWDQEVGMAKNQQCGGGQ